MAKDKKGKRLGSETSTTPGVSQPSTSKRGTEIHKPTGNRAGQSPKKVADFFVVRIGGEHTCYVKKHQGEDDRTMFMVNLPVDATEEGVKSLYSQAGDAVVEEVKLWKGRIADSEEDTNSQAPPRFPLPSTDPRHPTPFLPTSTSAHVTFATETGLHQALTKTDLPSWPNKTAVSAGLSFLLQRHKALRPALEAVRAHADSVIARFEWTLRHPQKKKSRIEAFGVGANGELLDADGFTIVQATGKYGRTTDASGGASVRVARARGPSGASAGRRRRGDDDGEEQEGGQKKKKKLELDDFYRFQRREAKREELADLRAKFQVDQEKIKKLKANRNFRPF